ncbi:MAG: pantoate--beta-alanine ligase [Flavobacteriales bacterium]
MSTVQALQNALLKARNSGQKVGFVPTMGALHDGHLSLVARARAACDVVVVSIFVNPTQFNNPQDLETYPRQVETDVALLAPTGVDFVFTPTIAEMYTPDEVVEDTDYGVLTHSLEGAFRPGHFNGVVAIVRKLFQAVQPNRAFFGEKDFQQLAILQELGRREFPALEVIGCPIIREPEGLAMSSRNALLSDQERQVALAISRTLFAAAARAAHDPPGAVRDWAWAQLTSAQGVDPEYVELVSRSTLEPTKQWKDADPAILLTAAQVGPVRLIDNCQVPSAAELRAIGEHWHPAEAQIG